MLQLVKIPPVLNPVSKLIDNTIPPKVLIKIQELLIRTGMYVKASDLIAFILVICIFTSIISGSIAAIMGLNIFLVALVGFLIPIGVIGGYLFYMMDKRVDSIEQGTPDFLRQIASLLRAGVGVETALEDVSRHGSGPLNEELKRSVIEIKMGRSFDEALLTMGERLQSKNLDRTFRMVLEGRKAGGSLSDVLETVAEDLRAVLALKRERKANVMMSVMFLIIAAIIAAPFALGMITVYSGFIESLGQPNPLLESAVLAATGYIVIHSIIAGLLIGIIMYGSAKKGVKFAIPLTILAYAIFYIINRFGMTLVGGFVG